MKRILLSVLLSFVCILSFAQGWTADWYTGLHLAAASEKFLPFWARTGHDGILPVSTGGTAIIGADLKSQASNGIYLATGFNLAGSMVPNDPLGGKKFTGLVDRLYVSAGWRMLGIDVGLKPRERELGDLSLTGGDIMYTRNARNMLGINMKADWIYFEKGHWFGFRGNLAHYTLNDTRYTKAPMIHNKSLAFKIALGRKVDFIVGLDHWAHWGGEDPQVGKQPSGFKDFLKIFLAQKGGDGATASDRLNVLGNHLGRELIRIDWRASNFTMNFQYDKPFEDGSGVRYQNFPDGVWTLQFVRKDRDAFVTDILFELATTTWQSGEAHDRPATEEEMKDQNPESPYYGKIVIGGCDNYFNNGMYRSGWTHYGRVIGLPLFVPYAPDSDGVTKGIVSNRLMAYHLALKGVFGKKVPYVFKATYSNQYGTYHQAKTSFFNTYPWQVNLAFELDFGKRLFGNVPLSFALGVYGDVGKLYDNSLGLTLRMTYREHRRF